MGVFIFAFTATGKSTVARKYRNVIDMESTHYKYIDNNAEDESLKSTVRDINREWPYNYFKELKKVKDKYDYWYVYPKRELKHEYLDRCKKRGNNEEFIYWYSKLWDEWIDKCKEENVLSRVHDKKKIVWECVFKKIN